MSIRSRLVFVVVCCWLPTIAAIRCYVCENDDPLCHDAFERSSGFEQECQSPEQVCFKKISHECRSCVQCIEGMLVIKKSHDPRESRCLQGQFYVKLEVSRPSASLAPVAPQIHCVLIVGVFTLHNTNMPTGAFKGPRSHCVR